VRAPAAEPARRARADHVDRTEARAALPEGRRPLAPTPALAASCLVALDEEDRIPVAEAAWPRAQGATPKGLVRAEADAASPPGERRVYAHRPEMQAPFAERHSEGVSPKRGAALSPGAGYREEAREPLVYAIRGGP
jgi:hypothetical protein